MPLPPFHLRAPLAWITITLVIAGYLSWLFFYKEDKRALLPGITSSGHHQIEQRCDSCHDSEPTKGIFTSSGVSNKACMECHETDLELANDSHPVIKFKNPENAIFLEHIQATQCIACHTEHLEERTNKMAVTVPPDYCAHCHESTLENRESHKGLAFNTCETAGCHNYHDNTALFENFLVKHSTEPANLEPAVTPMREEVYRWIAEAGARPAAVTPDAPAEVLARSSAHIADWVATSHANAGVNCSDCHGGKSTHTWQDRPSAEACASCHDVETDDFRKGKHGMRLAAGLSPMTPEMARLPMKPDSAHRQLDCVSCHGAHDFDREYAAAEACMNCHDDEHTRNFKNSQHYALWEAELGHSAPINSGVSCATCHMPTESRPDPETGRNILVVQHNQNANLRPNEKMYREVCMNCHGLAFTMDSLADTSLIESNFSGPPEAKVESVAWALEGEAERKAMREAREASRQAESESSTQPPSIDSSETIRN